jgi:hypothetical protein
MPVLHFRDEPAAPLEENEPAPERGLTIKVAYGYVQGWLIWISSNYDACENQRWRQSMS